MKLLLNIYLSIVCTAILLPILFVLFIIGCIALLLFVIVLSPVLLIIVVPLLCVLIPYKLGRLRQWGRDKTTHMTEKEITQ